MSFIKTRPFPCKRHIFQDHKFACHGLDEPQDKRNDGAGNEISRSETSNVSFHNASGWKVQQTSDPFLIKHQNVLLPYVKQNNQERFVQSYEQLLLTGSSCWSVSRINSFRCQINPLNAELNPICHLLALLGAQHFLHVSRIRVNQQ